MLPANINYCGSCGFTVKKVFTTKDTKSTKVEILIIRTLRVLRITILDSFRGWRKFSGDLKYLNTEN